MVVQTLKALASLCFCCPACYCQHDAKPVLFQCAHHAYYMHAYVRYAMTTRSSLNSMPYMQQCALLCACSHRVWAWMMKAVDGTYINPVGLQFYIDSTCE